MRLRLLCAHDREILSEDDLTITERISVDNAITLDDEEDDNRLFKCLHSKHAPWPRMYLIRRINCDA